VGRFGFPLENIQFSGAGKRKSGSKMKFDFDL
jgi:hypothetical protein